MGNTANKTDSVELTLLGIKKTWVRSKGEWRDKDNVGVKPEVILHEDIEGASKRWWQFWKKK